MAAASVTRPRGVWVHLRRGLSSAGRAPALQAGGHRFDPDSLHHPVFGWCVRLGGDQAGEGWCGSTEKIEFGHVWSGPESVGWSGGVCSAFLYGVRRVRMVCVERCWSLYCESGSGASLGVPRSASLTGCLFVREHGRLQDRGDIRSEAFEVLSRVKSDVLGRMRASVDWVFGLSGLDTWLMACFASVHGVDDLGREIWIIGDLERDKSIRWMPWHQEAMKDVARCEKPWGAASRL